VHGYVAFKALPVPDGGALFCLQLLLHGKGFLFYLHVAAQTDNRLAFSEIFLVRGVIRVAYHTGVFYVAYMDIIHFITRAYGVFIMTVKTEALAFFFNRNLPVCLDRIMTDTAILTQEGTMTKRAENTFAV